MKKVTVLILLMIAFAGTLVNGCKTKAKNDSSDAAMYESLGALAHKMEGDVERVVKANTRATNRAVELLSDMKDARSFNKTVYFRDRHGILSDHKRSRKTNVYVDRDTPDNAYTASFIAISEDMEPLWENNYKEIPDLGWQYLMETKYNSLRIYPWVETTRSFGPDIDWTKYGFYNCAMPSNNPSRKRCWGNIGYDMLGQGVISSISNPIYIGDEFVAIISTDFLVTRTFRKYLQEKLPGKNSYIALINSDSLVLFREEKDRGERGWDEMHECNVLSDCAKDNPSIGRLLESITNHPKGNADVMVGRKKRVYFQKLAEPDWILIMVTEVATS